MSKVYTVTLTGMLGQPSELSHIRKVTTAEVIMSNFIAMHNISFQTADHYLVNVCVCQRGELLK